jgi:hypothetical protein
MEAGELKCFKKKKNLKFKKNFNPPSPENGSLLCRVAIPLPPRRSRRAQRLHCGDGWIEMFQEKIIIFLFFFVFFYISKKFHPPCPHRGAIVHDGSSMGAGGLKCFKKKFIFIFIFQKKFNPPPPPTEPSCTTAPPWGRWDWNAIEPSTKFLFIYFFCLKHFNPC